MYVERQRKWIKEVGLEIGDKVLIVARANSEANGWDDEWVDGMDETVGLVGTVGDAYEESGGDYKPDWGILVGTDGKYWYYPFFVLVKVEE
jgi:hypothetical protein